MDICGDNRFEIIAKAKAHLLDATNIDTSEDEMKVLDSFLFRCWQMGWLQRYDHECEECMHFGDKQVCGRCRYYSTYADRKTENSSEKPNNCDDCIWSVCNYNKAFEDEPTISKMEQVEDEPQTKDLFTDRYGDVWEWRGDAWYCISGDEPQTDCAWK